MGTQERILFLDNRMPEAQWDVSGAFVYDKELLSLYDYFYTHYGIKIFSVVHGAPYGIWNSGRIKESFMRSPEQIVSCVQNYEARALPLDLTFTNTLLQQEHLSDTMGNELLSFVSEHNASGANAVILSSECLYEYVKQEYPTLKTVSSILKVTTEKGKGSLSYYEELAERFDKVMIHPDDIRNFGLLEQLRDKSKYEIIVNEYCIRDCPIRAHHYKSLSASSLSAQKKNDGFEQKVQKNGCQSMEGLLTSPKKFLLSLTRPEQEQLYDMGFRLFKVQGRGLANGAGVVWDVLDLILGPDKADSVSLQRLKTQCLEAFLVS